MVAAEVKELAQQTALATGDITTRIQAIQASSVGAADASPAPTTASGVRHDR